MNRDIQNYAMNYGQMSDSERKQRLFYLKNMYGEVALKEEMYAMKNVYNIDVPSENNDVPILDNNQDTNDTRKRY